ncbi:hypothetical protein ACN38_g1676 [Penicillium nordicum]|uniref:Uncharacterized protein n=1 Tax=Penicillium nordicum TaxID=229535 RepID=A0A0M8PGR4_9EURO|nr:hypothetical protein ACN38_g1676 [Penicillium nordicum]
MKLFDLHTNQVTPFFGLATAMKYIFNSDLPQIQFRFNLDSIQIQFIFNSVSIQFQFTLEVPIEIPRFVWWPKAYGYNVTM